MKQLVLMIATASLLAGVLAFRHSHHPASNPIASGYTTVMTVLEDGKLVSNVRRQVKSNGEFLEETDHLNPDGSVSKHTKLAGTLTHGAVIIDDTNRTLTYVGRAAAIHDVTETELKAVGYVREDSLLGYRVIVQRKCDAPQRCTEYWIAPELGSDDLKVDVVDDGHHLTKQAVSIVKGEPTFQIPDYPTQSSSRTFSEAKPEGNGR